MTSVCSISNSSASVVCTTSNWGIVFYFFLSVYGREKGFFLLFANQLLHVINKVHIALTETALPA